VGLGVEGFEAAKLELKVLVEAARRGCGRREERDGGSISECLTAGVLVLDAELVVRFLAVPVESEANEIAQKGGRPVYNSHRAPRYMTPNAETLAAVEELLGRELGSCRTSSAERRNPSTPRAEQSEIDGYSSVLGHPVQVSKTGSCSPRPGRPPLLATEAELLPVEYSRGL